MSNPTPIQPTPVEMQEEVIHFNLKVQLMILARIFLLVKVIYRIFFQIRVQGGRGGGIYNHCLIRFNISSAINDFGFNSIQTFNFQFFSNLNALGSKFDLDVKLVKVNLGSLFEQTW